MADYIRSNILSQAYVHIDPLEIDESRLDALKSEIELYLQTRGRDHLKFTWGLLALCT